jgi:rod shape-determining protein MreC
MRNLLLFLWRHLNLILFIIIEIFCIVLIVNNNSYQRSSAISSANKIAGTVYSAVNTLEGYFNLRQTNMLLAEENARLHSISPSAYAKYINRRVIIHDTVYKQQYEYVFANVVNNSVNRRNNYLTLDKGSLHGIKPEMAVITASGIVGITKDVSPHFSSVLSVLNKDARISAKIRKNSFFGSLFWEGIDYKYGTLTDIPTHAGIKIGDTIVTNAYSAIFPDNIMIGQIESFSVKPGDNFYSIKVRFSTDFKNLSQVYVIRNLFKGEQRNLEQRSQNDN